MSPTDQNDLLSIGTTLIDAVQWPSLSPQCHLSPRICDTGRLRDCRGRQPDQYLLGGDVPIFSDFGRSGRPTSSSSVRLLHTRSRITEIHGCLVFWGTKVRYLKEEPKRTHQRETIGQWLVDDEVSLRPGQLEP